MARKRPIEDPPSASSYEKEGDSSEGNNLTVDGEEEEVKIPLKKEKADSDMSLPSPNISHFTIKPIVPKPKHSANDSI
ncbi:hypothetical protein J1N35_026360 [Gossypium stocksii]|uniref:Uncharacterized protein n=1 Tax=Gossypium stocksii TaxID=47602 RepID=A0A9D3V861_9ROSI|nr:hypothetical protein J1N35_026360 [Gossypium stocksii]